MTEQERRFKETLEQNEIKLLNVLAGGKVWAARLTDKNADHLYELEPAGPSDYTTYQIDLREPASLVGYDKRYNESEIGEIKEIEQI